jgi:hypothetical protein
VRDGKSAPVPKPQPPAVETASQDVDVAPPPTGVPAAAMQAAKDAGKQVSPFFDPTICRAYGVACNRAGCQLRHLSIDECRGFMCPVG